MTCLSWGPFHDWFVALKKKMREPFPVEKPSVTVCLREFSVQSLSKEKQGDEASGEHFSFQFSEVMRGKEHLCFQSPFPRIINRSGSFFPCLVYSDETLFLSLQADRRVRRGLCNHSQTGTWPHIMFEKFPVFRDKCGVCSVFCVLPVCC